MTDNRIRTIVVLGGGSAGWMAAAALATYLGRGVSVRLVESEEVGIVGVGESSVPHMKTFNSETLGIDERTFVTRTNATFKLGIRFTDWGRIGDSYIHGFGTIGQGLGPLPFHQLWLRRFLAGKAAPLGDYSLQTVAAPAGRFQWNGPPGSLLSDIAYAYHLDAVLYARFLRELAERRGVERIEGKVVDVEQQGENGHVAAITLADGRRVEGEFFIDCSGFRGVLIEQTLKTGYLDWRHWLPCDRAFAVPSETVGPPMPYTEAAARSSGWQWRIPLQHRVGNGHVYSSAYESDEQAMATLLDTLQGQALDVPRQLRFTAGRRVKAWSGNVVALGLAAGFLEPLESTGIYLAQAGIRRLLGLFPGRDFDPALADRFNRETALEYERTRDFLVLHYKATTRDDTPFWRYCRTMDVPDPLREAIELFRADGRYFRNGEDFFALPSWVQVMIGQGIVPADYHPIVDAMPEGHLDQYLARVRGEIAGAVAAMPPHHQFIDHHCKATVA
ncbi:MULTISPECIES: tryptophan halogenase family protein [unclassified Sphingomonas]|uniref:tryptophan halogenase family protein n=1 Tax=unclassified Sphingomonas TaxID=196159 RepID=UPI0006FADB01|nr:MULTISPECIES: tryptophan halogenase family protein [unclassified Sphingomonas]KQM28194.1 tryptophan halogenase [Sphingomonas sp. Leaf9]KQM44536.1 tryptophan halogenase [Sphingomonas sp. Leaf11]